MKSKLVALAIAAALALALFLTCDEDHAETAPGQPNELHPNTTSPDEQGESGSLLETE